MSDDGELAFLDRLAARLPAPPPGQTWIGDDTAVLADGRLLATDLLVEGVHFRSAWARPADVGFKALAVNLSDLAAMGGVPEAAVAAVAVPPDRPGLADEVAAGLAECAARFDCPLVGGDTSVGPALYLAVTVTGTTTAPAPVLRSGASPGEVVFVTGALGGAAAVLALLEAGRRPDPEAALALHRPVPRLAEGRVAATAGATAMLDLSDGAALDIGRLARASGVGVEVAADRVPLAEGADLTRALTGGDDYELCFTAPDEERVRAAFAAARLRPPVAIGRTDDTGEVTVRDESGRRRLAGGWEHRLG